ncbi:MAG TPA: NADH-quinone oxidoreductase subunit N [Cyclobacteriaceae bacterium]|nr:NADH-quinone oxidoreductase subunit N [Cyclobacteriaceae bacterium]HMV08345.1 NADH-quinone oxidoreductase subunit N [Cyclobacteriaceae bacterium]HMV88378.1 NADH-quinone oxidoreductase subunit N [Cyclobacteriaceae bacterium]HMX02188.1 NADH-quinone oxidoreductase subunit N [Cyclobacteriaceae bacterium]HMX49836.1 NADH-quinone oxidoreductase subunit N [Cyclobacteriaceae bacterium]
MESGLSTKLKSISISLYYAMPELILACGILLLVVVALFLRGKKTNLHALLTLAILTASIAYTFFSWAFYHTPVTLFGNMIHSDQFSCYFRILVDVATALTVLMAMRNKSLSEKFNSEFYTFLLGAVLGSHLLMMSTNLVMVFISLELLSISSYILAGYSFTKKGAEGSLKYFLFGSAASAIMLYGFSILFGITGTLEFTAGDFVNNLSANQSALVIVAAIMAFAGFLYKIAAAPMHIWAPDVYEGSPMPVIAFLSVVPKLAGIVVLAKMTTTFATTTVSFDWQLVMAVIAMLSIGIGNLSALWQNNAKRMMAYSSIAQSGFLLIGVVCLTSQSMQAFLFYSALYLAANYAVFISLQAFEKNSIDSIASFSGTGRSFLFLSVVLLGGLISLTGIPPTGGFTSKLFMFASLWASYEQTGKTVLLWLLIFGLLNTVVSLFYYLKIPYYAFLKSPNASLSPENTRFENFLAFILVVGILFLFIRPDFLMGWLNTINFVL